MGEMLGNINVNACTLNNLPETPTPHVILVNTPKTVVCP